MPWSTHWGRFRAYCDAIAIANAGSIAETRPNRAQC
jgi:hypothetical protein